MAGLVPAMTTMEAPRHLIETAGTSPGDDIGGWVDPVQRASEAT